MTGRVSDNSIAYPLQKTLLNLIHDNENLFVWNLNDACREYLTDSRIDEKYSTWPVPITKIGPESAPPKGTCLISSGVDSGKTSIDVKDASVDAMEREAA